MRHAILLASGLTPLACGNDTGDGDGGGPPEGTFECGGDSGPDVEFCVEGEEYCVEQYSDDEDVVASCLVPDQTCDADSPTWCDCISEQQGCVEDLDCDPGRSFSCL